MTESIKTEATPAATGEKQAEKLFTQAELDSIISKRLSEKANSQSKALDEREAELKQRELKLKAQEALKAAGLSAELADVISFDSDESLTKAVELLKADATKRYEAFKSELKVIPNPLPKGEADTNGRADLRKAFDL